MIVIDFRERMSGIDALLEQRGVPCCYQHLQCGDYVVNNDVVIERKTTNDFLESLKDKRLYNQTARIRSGNTRALMIIEGSRLPAYPRVRGVLISLAVQWYLPVIRTRTLTDTAWALEHIHKYKIFHARPGHVYDFRDKRVRQSVPAMMLQCIPGIGPALADDLLRTFGSLTSVLTAPKKELMCVDGIGPVLAERIGHLSQTTSVATTTLQIHSQNEFTNHDGTTV